jgi:hypothetical protein
MSIVSSNWSGAPGRPPAHAYGESGSLIVTDNSSHNPVGLPIADGTSLSVQQDTSTRNYSFGPAAMAASFFAFALACHRTSPPDTSKVARPMTINTVIERRSAELLEIPGVVGVAQGAHEGQSVVQILVERRTPELMARLPRTMDGFPVVVVESGEIRSQ